MNVEIFLFIILQAVDDVVESYYHFRDSANFMGNAFRPKGNVSMIIITINKSISSYSE